MPQAETPSIIQSLWQGEGSAQVRALQNAFAHALGTHVPAVPSAPDESGECDDSNA